MDCSKIGFEGKLSDPFYCRHCGKPETEHTGNISKPVETGDFDSITFVLDRSGSMQSCKEQTIIGFNKFIEDQRKIGKAFFTLVQFDDIYEVVYDNVPISDVALRTETNYLPRGGTALLDAMGKAITTTKERIDKLDKMPKKIIVGILTDGMENESHEFKRKQVFDLIEELKPKGWEFYFLSAEPSAVKEAVSNYGIDARYAASYQTSNTAGTFQGMSSSISAARTLGSKGLIPDQDNLLAKDEEDKNNLKK